MKTTYPLLTLKPERASGLSFGHPWLFSGAIEKKPEGLVHGALVHVADPAGKILGTGTYSTHSSIAVRICEFGEALIGPEWFEKRFKKAEAKRTLLGYGPGTPTTGYRMVFGESDGVPGLVVDRYEDVLVIQISTAGMEALKPLVVGALKEVFKPRSIVERNDVAVRMEEGLELQKGVLWGKEVNEVEFLENGFHFEARVMNGQKTGFFLDQKDLRLALQPLAKDREILNLFSYTGATHVPLFKGGAKSITAVDSSADALEGCAKNLALNRLKKADLKTEEADIFQWLSTKSPDPAYDMVILDPPALIRRKTDLEESKKAYHFLNRAALRLLRDDGIFVTSSCSHHLSEEDFIFMLRRASVQAGVTLDILKVIHQSPDHPVSLYFPESAYLKSVVGVVHR